MMSTREPKDAFADQQRLLRGHPVRTILDVGAHVGSTTEIYLNNFPEAAIYAVEPFPKSQEELRRKFAGVSRVKVCGTAVAEASGARALYANRDSATNSLLPTAATASAWVSPPSEIETLEQVEVPVATLDDLCRQESLERIDILKLDIQGGELRALQGARDLLRRRAIRLIYSEILFVPLYDGQADFYELAAFLASFGYTLFDMYNFVWSDAGQVKWGDAIVLSPGAAQRRCEADPVIASTSSGPAAHAPAASSLAEGTAECGGTIDQARPVWHATQRLRRPPITDGFIMPGFAGRYWIWPEEYSLLAKYVDLTRGDYLEIGSMCGIIAMSLAEKYPNRQFVCVDNFSAGHGTIAGERETFFQNWRDHELRNVRLVEGDSLQVVPTLTGPFGAVFVDANHAYEYVLGDGLNGWRLLAPNGIIAFHDFDYVDETTRAVGEFIRRTGARIVEGVSSLVVLRKTSPENDNRSPWEKRLEQVERQLREQRAQLARQQDELARRENELAHLREQNQELEALWRRVESSAGWRALNRWRRLRDRLAPEGTARRRWYDSVLKGFRGSR